MCNLLIVGIVVVLYLQLIHVVVANNLATLIHEFFLADQFEGTWLLR